MNWIDRAISTVAPIHAERRMAARQAIKVINSGYGNYGASLTKKSLRGWLFRGGSAKEDIEDNIDVLRQRSRDAYMGVPTASAALKSKRTNVIASGLVPVPKIDADYLGLDSEQAEKLQAQILREFSLWAEKPLCDADRIDNFYALQQLAFISYLMNGDVFALLPFKEEKNQVYGLKIRLIEADRICSPDNYDRLFPCDVNGYHVYRIVQGVETDEDGVVIAYWISNRHPLSSLADGTVRKWTRVEVYGSSSGRRNVLHIMSRERIGQLRGVPMLAPVLEAIKQLGRYTDAEVTAAVISSMFTVFVQPELATDDRPFGEQYSPEALVDEMDNNTIEMGSGAIVDLNPGETVNFADPKHPNSGYDVFTNAVIRQIGAALEIPIEVLMKQFTTSFSAARGALNEFWRTCDMERGWFEDDFCRPIYEEWFTEAVARGRINAPGFFNDPIRRMAYMGCSWNGPARTAMNPSQEVDAAIKRIEHGFSTAQEETAQMTGGDYNSNIRQRKIEAARKREVDLIVNPPERTEGNA